MAMAMAMAMAFMAGKKGERDQQAGSDSNDYSERSSWAFRSVLLSISDLVKRHWVKIFEHPFFIA